MFIATAEEMRKLDRYMIDVNGVSAAVLMENAGREVARETEAFSLRESVSNRWLFLIGKGNNGGDGLVAARHLREAGWAVTLVYANSIDDFSLEARLQWDIAQRIGIPALIYGKDHIDWSDYDGIMDGLLGTGSKGALREPMASLIRDANASGLPIIAIDIPSGLNADTGEVNDPCIRATVTIALAFLKCGLTQYPGIDAAGEIIVRLIGIPPQLAAEQGIRTFLLEEKLFKERLGVDPILPRQADSNKGTYGHVLVAAGTRAMSGAGLLCSKAALRMGCGLSSWALPNSLLEPMMGRVPETMLLGLPDREQGDWSEVPASELILHSSNKEALVIGPGMGRFPQDCRWLREVWEGTACPLVVDADALNMIAADANFAQWGRRAAAVILTPHPGEMARLAGVPVHIVQRDRIGLARRYAVQHGVTLVLKGARTVCATPEGVVYVNTTGNPGMATAGAGDVLAGMLGSLLAQGLRAEQAACLGVYLHGAAGDRAAAKRNSVGSLIAGDIIEEL